MRTWNKRKSKRNRAKCEPILTVGYFSSLEEECEEVTEVPDILLLPSIVDHGLGGERERDKERGGKERDISERRG
jgi:hypothetical protein